MSNNPSETSGANQSALQGTCFVVMGFGKKTDFETGRVLDLDQSYRNLIKPAVEKAGLKCVRADEIVHSGLIDVPMYEQLLQADVVVADLSTSNRNAFYELGVRHALRPYTTVVIAEEQMMKTAPFDVNHISIRKYRHLGEDIGFSEVQRFTQELSEAIRTIMATQPKPAIDSPVYRFIARLTPPSVEAEIKQAIEEARAAKGSAFARATSTEPGTPAHSELMARVDEAQRKGDWLKAKMLLEEIRDMRKAPIVENAAEWKQEDPYILQRLALATYKSEHPSPEAALAAARDLLQLLEPEVSNDTETLGLWAAVHKRLWDLTSRPRDLDEAIRGAERGYYLRNDYYNGINYAFLLNVRASIGQDLAEAVADFVQARRVRREVIKICEQWLASDHATETETPRSSKSLESRYWVLATLAEAHVGLEDDRLGKTKLEEAFAAAPNDWMKQSTQEQIGKLQALLEKSPLENLRSLR
jgi:hypothetical protein